MWTIHYYFFPLSFFFVHGFWTLMLFLLFYFSWITSFNVQKARPQLRVTPELFLLIFATCIILKQGAKNGFDPYSYIGIEAVIFRSLEYAQFYLTLSSVF